MKGSFCPKAEESSSVDMPSRRDLDQPLHFVLPVASKEVECNELRLPRRPSTTWFNNTAGKAIDFTHCGRRRSRFRTTALTTVIG